MPVHMIFLVAANCGVRASAATGLQVSSDS